MKVRFVVSLSFLLMNLFSGASVLHAEEMQGQHFSLPSWGEWRDVMVRGQGRWALDIDNDSLLLKKDDGLYTSGYRLQRSYNLVQNQQQTSYRWYLGQELYTPSDIKWQASAIPKYERPYAGWLYLGWQREHYLATGAAFKFGLELGCMGPCAAGEWSQTKLHQAIHQPLPRGWSTQVGQAWGAQLNLELATDRWTPLANLDVAPTVKLRAGRIFTELGAGLLWRYGDLNALPDQSARYWFVRTELRLVGRNATIENSRLDPDLLPKSDVAEAELGYLWQGRDYGLSLAVIRRSSEVQQIPNSRGAQNFVRMQLQYRH